MKEHERMMQIKREKKNRPQLISRGTHAPTDVEDFTEEKNTSSSSDGS